MNLIDYLHDTSERFPDKLAISDENIELTFSQLKDQAMAIATRINSTVEGKNNPILVEVDRRAESIILFLGVLSSGNFYVPLDNKLPKERINTIISDVDPKLLLTIDDKRFGDYDLNQIQYTDSISTEIDYEFIENTRKNTIDMDPAYMMYTSGSTGVPKGVVISHRMVMDFSDFLHYTFDIDSEDIIANQAPFYFDCSVKCIYQMLRNGSTLYILKSSYFMFPIKLVEFLNEKNVTTLLWATSGLNIVSRSGVFDKLKPSTLNKVFFSGEMLYAKDYHLWKEACDPSTLFANIYGPTEVTVDCTYYTIERDFRDDEVIPIGKRCRNMEVFVIDEDGQLVKDTETDKIGELYARGTGISYGYYNNPSETEKVFIQNPLQDNYRDICYRTGDLVKYNEFKELVFVSRSDNQIKHMGNRIELGEVEVKAMTIDGIKDAVAFYDEDRGKIVLAAETTLESRDIVRELRDLLPRYMTPNHIDIYDRFPKNRNGKIDRVKLKELYSEENQ